MAGIYIHVPFCISKCHYCDFFKTTKTEMLHKYVFALKNEFVYRKNVFDFNISTIYFGGGTPSLISISEYKEIFSRLKRDYTFTPDAEITIEANPDDLTKAYLDGLIEVGFNRISIGVQSFFDEDLKKMGRRHNGNQAFQMVLEANRAGFNNISLDLIYGLPWSDSQIFTENFKVLNDLPYQHLSAYHLSIEKGTNFYDLKKKGILKEIIDEESLNQYNLLCNYARKSNMLHYEVSNFCLSGFKSKHNSAYWDGTPYMGFGSGSHSFYNNERHWNKSNLQLYLNEKFDLLTETESLTSANRYNEIIMLGLRSDSGINISSIDKIFSDDFNTSMNKWIDKGVLLFEDGYLKCTETGWFIVDAIIEDFFTDTNS